jgi:isoquinoline 1-oxidoreductase subunit beta
MLRIFEAPAIEVFIVPSEEKPTGVGEPSVPPVAPALSNAIFAAAGRRVRRLPIRNSDLVERGTANS